METAAGLFNHHVFLDLETTGLDPATDEVIEVGALFIDQGRPVRRISRLFRPSRPLEPIIHQLTGLTDESLTQAPSFASFIPDLTHALLGWTVVAHNASFEQGFLRDLLGQIEAPVLDSCELLHYLHPELTSHSLDAMVRWADLGGGARHRALADCEDT
jgi:ATP-dependent DNA helicase DinG